MSELVKVDYKEYGIEESKSKELIGNLPQIQLERDILQKQYNEVIKLDIDEKETSKIAKELRLKILKNRTQGLGTWHKTTKDYFLKGGQFVDAIKRKEEAVNVEMETTLEAIEKHAENQEKERIAELQKTRLSLISEYVEDTTGLDLGNMPDEVFEGFFNLKKTQKAEKIEAERIAEEKRIEEENKVKLHNERKEVALPFYQFWTDFEKTLNFGEQSESDFNSFMDRLKTAKQSDDDEKEKQKVENARLKKEQEAKDELRKTRSPLLQPYIVFIRDYNTLIDKPETEFVKELEEIKKGAELQWEHERQEAKKEAIRIAGEAKIKAEADAKLKAEQEARAKEENAKKEAEKLAKTPIKNQLTAWVETFQNEIPEHLKDDVVANDILTKFWAFKSWAKSEIEKI